MGVMIKEALANGRLTARGDVEALHAAAQRTGATEDALAIAAVLGRAMGQHGAERRLDRATAPQQPDGARGQLG